MSNLLVQDTSLIAIADAIREKTGSTELIMVKDMPTQIEDINVVPPDCEIVSFGVDGEFEDKYAITSARLNEIADEAQRLVNTEEALTPSQIVEDLQNIVDDDAFMEGTVSKIHNDTVTKIKPYLCYQDTTVSSVDCPNVTTIGVSSFYGCNKLTDVNLPQLTSVPDHGFRACGKLTNFSMPLITSIGICGFNGCDSIKEVEFAELENIGDSAFEHCDSLERFNAPKLKTIGKSAFYFCRKLKEINCPEVTTINSGLTTQPFGSTGLINISFPKLTSVPEACFFGSALENIDLSVVTSIAMQAFGGCSKIRIINAPLLTSLGRDGFQHSQIEDINGGTVNMPLLRSASTFSFSDCKKLKTVYLPELTSIDQSSFQGCTALTRCEFVKQVSMSYTLFQNCTALETLILRSETMCPLSYTNAFSGSSIALGTGYVYVPKALVDTYKTNSNWATYATQIRAIEDWPDVCDGKEVVRNYTVDTTKEADYIFNKEYVNYADSYSLKTEFKYESAEETIDSGRMTSLKIITNDKQSVEGVVIE